ncbi:MAG: hypothetical protein KGI27_04505 [Thaumarchaeota archaeon]|nr:hypothetical protein [Nitrososphaerota archaeon]
MFLKTKNRKAISAVLATLIILVATVVLGTGVVLFGTSLFQTNSQSSGLTVQGVHVWVNATKGMTTTYAWGAAEIRNSGDKILSVDQISVRGTQVPYANWFFDSNPNDVTTANLQSQLNYTGTTNGTGTAGFAGEMKSYKGTNNPSVINCVTPSAAQFYINEFGNEGSAAPPTLCLAQASGPISLKPGEKAVVYFEIPIGVLSTVDGGSNSNVAIYSGSVGSPQSVTIQAES